MLGFEHLQRIMAVVVGALGALAIVAFALVLFVLVASGVRAGDDEYRESRATDRAHCVGYGIDAACGYRAPWRVRQLQRQARERWLEDLRPYRRDWGHRGHHLPGLVVSRERRTFKVDRRAWEDADHGDRWNHGRRCERAIAVVGDQYASEAGAQGEADKAWMQTARWQYGERFMSRENAVDPSYECGRSSVGSVVGQVFYRCRLTATPCAPARSRAN